MRTRVAILAALLPALAAPVAHAGTVSLTTTGLGTEQTSYDLRWTGDPGEANTATVSWRSGAFHLADSTAPVIAGDGCRTAGPNEATCAASDVCRAGPGVDCSFLFELTLDGGDSDDVLGVGALPALRTSHGLVTQSVALELDGGDGNDTLTGSDQDDVLQGGSGRDTLEGGAGSDVLVGDGIAAPLGGQSPPDAPAAADVLDGGPDDDTVSYANRAEPVVVDLGGAGGAGEMGEGDQLTSIEDVVGGAGDDILTGDARPNDIWGAAGADRIDGAAGADTLTGGTESDELHGGLGDDLLQGDGWREDVEAPPPPSTDVLDGGDGADTASWATRDDPVRVDLSDPGPDGEASAPDTLTSIENAEGSRGSDVLIGDDGPNILDGGLGADSLTGKGGDDKLVLGEAGSVDGGAGNDIIRGGGGGATCGPGQDRIGVIFVRVPPRDCETIVFLSYLWDPLRSRAGTPLLELKNATPRLTRKSVTFRLRCPTKACRGVLRLGPGYATRKLRLRGTAWRSVRVYLTKRGRRHIAQGHGGTEVLRFAGTVAPVRLKVRR